MRRRILLGGGLLLLVLLGLAVRYFTELSIFAMTPRAPFDASAAPRPPDYADAAAWSARPGGPHAADAALAELPGSPQSAAPVDVFYVHPTTYVGSGWNGPVDDPQLNAATDRVATRIQASALNACCAIYAPRYRQANGTAFTHPTETGQRAIDLAYGDVRRAFGFFLENHSHGRPFIVAAHSQGSILARRLLAEEVSQKPLRSRLVVAYLIGVPLLREVLARDTPDIPVCADEAATGCLVSWNARGPEFRPGGKLDLRYTLDGPPPEGICVNPLSWKADEVAVGAEQNLGAVFLDAEPPVLLPHFAGARCRGGFLELSAMGKAPRDLMSRLLDRALGPGNYHPIEYQIFFANIRHNAGVRVAAFLKNSAPAN